jgi:hypothetical protein
MSTRGMFLTLLRFACMLADLTGPGVATPNLPPSSGKRGHEEDDGDPPRKQIRLSKPRAPIGVQRQCNWCQRCLRRLLSLPADGSSVRCLHAGTRTRCEYCAAGNRRSSDCVVVCLAIAIDSHASRSPFHLQVPDDLQGEASQVVSWQMVYVWKCRYRHVRLS